MLPCCAILLFAALTLDAAPADATAALAEAESLIEKERLPDAEALLRKLLTAHPGDTQIAFRLAYVEFRQRKLLAARQRFAGIVKAAPPAHNSRYFLGRIALLENQPAAAIAWLEPVAAAGGSVYDAASQLALAYANAGQARKAVPHLETAIQQAPWDAGLYYRLGRLRQQLGEPELAREAMAQSTRLRNANRQDLETLMALSDAVKRRGPEALELSARLTGRADTDPAMLVAAGLVWVQAGVSEKAIEAFQQAAARDGNGFASQFNLGLALLRAGDAAEALTPLTRARELLPQSPEANLTAGLAAVMLRRYQEAKPPLEAARKLNAANPRIAALLATAHLRTGDAAAAVRLLRESHAGEASDPAGALLLVEALYQNKEAEAALAAARQAAARFPKEPAARMALAQQLARAGQYQQARPEFAEVLRLTPGNPEASLGLADTLQKAGDHGAAIEPYQAAIAYGATARAAVLGLARSLVALRRLEEARALLENGKRQFADDVPLRVELSRVYARLGERALAAQETEAVERLKAGTAQP